MSDEPLLEVEDLAVHFHTEEGIVHAVDGVSFAVEAGETVCLVGESGSGKTVTAESITRLIETPPGEIVSGSVRFRGEDLTTVPVSRLREIRGDEIAHVFQNPQDALNPVYTAGRQIAEVLEIHTDLGKEARRRRVIDLLDRVGIADPTSAVDAHPHELSGGQKQRVMIAMALAARPTLLIADEPTTALDATVQAGILDLLSDLQEEFDMAVLFVTHDLGVVARIADSVVVMYAGKVMERGGTGAIFDRPGHPYTRALLACLPGRGSSTRSIGGELPDPTAPPDGCRFAPRCPYAIEDCQLGEQPELEPIEDGRDVEESGEVDADASGDEHVASCIFYAPGYDRSRLDADRSAIGGENAVRANGEGDEDE